MAETIRVLLVDDEPDVAALAVEFLERENDRLDVVTATQAQPDRIDEETVDCIVSDYQMPGRDGLNFLAAVREDRPDLPFILFTGRGSEEVASDALSRGVTDYLQKGSGTEDYELLANRIENAVERYRAQERAAALGRVRTIVRDINQALVRASSRSEIATEVCEIVTEPESVRFAVFSSVDPDATRVEPRAWAGADGDVSSLDAMAVAEPTDPPTPHQRAVHDRAVVISEDIQADSDGDPWREAVDANGIQAVAVVPIEHEDHLYGLLTIYGARTRSIDGARDLLVELGDDIAHAFYALDTRRQLAESEARYRNLAETASDAILRIDDASTIRYANPATERLFGYTMEELRGASLTMLMPERFRDRHREGIARYLRTGERQLDWTAVELPGQRKDGTEVPLAITFGEFDHDGQQFFTGILRDVTEREERKAELRRQIESLDEFAGTVAHDLRNPLEVATGRLELAREAHDGEHLEVAAAALERMDRLIEDLLTLARENRPIEADEPVDLADAVATARRVLDGERVTVETDGRLGTILARRSRVLAIVENLFQNAVEHGGADVTIRVAMLDDGFAVEDDGLGIPAADRDAVFEPGYTTTEAGTGFGLTVVDSVVDASGWDVAITDGADGGARFEITGVDIDR